jgi:regulatory protein YycI of two-component signal transduction system YycFG
MKWGQIKTLFILCFLLLDIYLLNLVIQKQRNEDLTVLDSGQGVEAAIEENLEGGNIILPEDLSENLPDEGFVRIRQKSFKDSEIKQIEALENQEVNVVNNTFILSLIDKKIVVPENAKDETIAELVSTHVYLGDEYQFEYWDKSNNILVFFQIKNNRPVYYNLNGMIFIYLNDNNEAIAYTQSVLGEPEVESEKKSLLKPLSAVNKLYENNLIISGDKVTEVEMGLYTQLPLDSGQQLLAPTWKITVNDSRDRFVNAIEQIVVPVDQNYVRNVLEISIENTRALEGEEEFKESMLEILNSKLENNRSEAS